MDTDLRNTRARLRRLLLAAAIGAVFTVFTMKAMLSSGRGPNHDPVGASIAPLLAIFVFVVTTGFGHSILSRRK
ncbi:MAG: hypothetical protein JO257_26830 [Deltaproteobacteria bacterium]|nr:hypothetical protein [Deltaproteobacteria bacterium]